MSVLIAIPTLDEERDIGAVIETLVPFAERCSALVVVADGGSSDGTCAIVRTLAARHSWLALIDNPGRFQSAAVNRVVEQFGDSRTWLIRMDAHSNYPPDFCDILLAEADATGADSVVVRMNAVGHTPMQRLVAAAQNSRFGNGGSAHRNRGHGAWVDHGHHALIRITAFQEVGGYDPSFTHNEDAELDHRLIRAGCKIWLTARSSIDYYPRASIPALVRQYFKFGHGRARNLSKHEMKPATRQKIVAALAPAVLCSFLAPIHWIFALPAALWGMGCVAAGIMIALDTRDPRNFWSGPIAGLMHLAWSLGFWVQRLSPSAKAV
ncbi:glycosyltransferase family 2 protein [Palleronia abyssalis]|uniref:Glycosyltransferase 2-like domain-containing protein n=1 Tax=Palleronia abyssalis TaxID=1501240 RepID=A0A2R8BZC8_9RHOB|nr:glycosyltransferase family 2 protein [Palleronia abyssalis]SPJ25531.1 hypothetical protein PAA8504_03382 [Palleronia abyssalis]